MYLNIIQNNLQFWMDGWIDCGLTLATNSEPHSLCYIETANLDGETNLKIRQAVPATAGLLSAAELSGLSGLLLCDPPNRHLYEFNGALRLGKAEPLALGADQLLQRGARLQNTRWATGLVLYTGHETKLLQNSAAAAPLKVLPSFFSASFSFSLVL